MTYTIVYFLDSNTFGGTEQALLHLLTRLDRKRWKPVLFHYPEAGIDPLLEETRRLDVKTVAVPRMQGAGAIFALPRFFRCLRNERPAIFHAYLNWLLSCKYGLLAASFSRRPVVIATLQQYLLPPWGKNIYLQQRLVSAGVDKYIAVSHAVARQLSEDFRVPANRVEVIHNSVPFAPFTRPLNHAHRAKLNQGSGQPIVLTVARLDEQKGHKYLLDAICQVPQTCFVLAGDGPERPLLEAQARSLGIADRVHFLGHRTDVPELLANCDLFVLPSIYEGLPLSILEAMAAGKAVIATAAGGIPEIVVEGETGFLVPPGDPAAIANAIRTVLADPGLACRMGAAGRKRIQHAFSVDEMAGQISQIYADFVERPDIREKIH